MAKRRPKFNERIQFSDGVREVLQQQLRSFRQRFGRDPGPDDPVFFDASSDSPLPLDLDELQRDILSIMHAARIPPDLIYAYLRTGLMVTEDNQRYLSAEDREIWNRALAEYSQHRRDDQR
jgi:hypothetical protein